MAYRKDHLENPGVLFRVGCSAKPLENNKVIATEFDAEELTDLTKSDIEIR